MVKTYFKALFFIFNVGVLSMPVAVMLMALISFISPNEDHIQLIVSHSEGIPLQVGYSGGSYSCVNSDCDYSNYIKQYSYMVFPDSLESDTFYKVSNPHTGELSVSSYEQPFAFWFSSLFIMLVYGGFMVRYYAKRITMPLFAPAVWVGQALRRLVSRWPLR